jgi:mRNA interferase RelE/StbE
MRYEIEVTKAARKDLAALPRNILEAVDACIQALASNPRPLGCKKLKGGRGLYRMRVGDYRIIYTIADGKLVIVIVRVGNRRDVYRSI